MFRERRQPLQDGRVHPVEELLLCGEDDLLALELRAGEVLDPMALCVRPSCLLPLEPQLPALRAGVLEHPLALRVRGLADLPGLRPSTGEDFLDDSFEPHRFALACSNPVVTVPSRR